MTKASPGKLDSGARGGLAGLAVVAAAFVAMAAFYTTRPWICAGAMAGVGSTLFVVSRRVARNRRRHFSAVLWLVLSLMMASALAVLRFAPTDELRRYWDEEPQRTQNVLLTAATLAAVSLISFWMLGRSRRGDRGT